jgi:hypothetical protein
MKENRFKTVLRNIITYKKLNVVMNPNYEKMYHDVIQMAEDGYYKAIEFETNERKPE